MTNIDFLGTKKFHDHYSNPGSVLESYRDYFRDYIWEDQVNDDNYYYYWPGTVVDVTSKDYTYLFQKVEFEDSWLDDNWSNFYNTSDSIIVLDYWGNGGASGAACDEGTAGTGDNQTATVDIAYSPLPPFYDGDSNAYKKIVGHEIGHLYNATHAKASVDTSDQATVVKTNGTTAGCDNYGSPESVKPDYSRCNASDINYHINIHDL